MNENDDILQEAVLVGNNRPRLGLLLFTRLGSTLLNVEVVERVWNTIESSINGKLSVDLDKNMLIVVRDFIIPRTGKGNFIRPEVYFQSESIVEETYSATV